MGLKLSAMEFAEFQQLPFGGFSPLIGDTPIAVLAPQFCIKQADYVFEARDFAF